MTPAHNAKVLTTGIAIASTLGLSNIYTIQSNAQILEKIGEAQASSLSDPALVAITPVVAPTAPAPATSVTIKNKNGTITTYPIAGVAPVTTDPTTTSTGVPATSATLPITNAPASNAPASNAPASNAPIATNPPAVVAPTPPTTAPATSASK